ncbi:hypothetical protein TH53_08335 [Pedobacter lusitanus]|uniref:Uncharacterized protein n=1 Tax=Pedobacter lusitanus TaxID=1503925 RepID=A0A0D0GT29_9SPHI|nr:hypothetical protein [Pedobacter lusitanus]KIO77641.1 hypothetical protein TH53_08335 [Pedobacter lusitanus]
MSTTKSFPKNALRFIFGLGCITAVSCITPQNSNAQSTEVTKVTFQKDKYNRIFIPVKIDKDSMSLLFGTYSKPLRLAPYFQSTRALTPSWDILTLTAPNGKPHDRLLFYSPKITVGNLKFRSEQAIVNYAFPDSLITGSTGTEMVYRYNWKINNDHNEISISKLPFTPAEAFTTINYKNDSYPKVAVEIEGVKTFFALDFGSGACFQLNSRSDLGRRLIATYKLKPVKRIISDIHARKLADTIYEVKIPSLLFNGIELTQQKVQLSSAFPQNIVGTGFLGDYNVILNNSRKRKIGNTVILEKRLAK